MDKYGAEKERERERERERWRLTILLQALSFYSWCLKGLWGRNGF
jgi:hypothetical protein